MNQTAIIVIVIALIFYTIGVWADKIQGRLKFWHLILFVIGLTFDVWGTSIMYQMAGKITYNFHSIIGFIAIFLMFINTIGAFIVLITKDEKRITKFHHYSISIWIIWLISFLSPMFMHMI